MKIGVVGTFNRDIIYPWKGEKAESIGGLYFSVLYLANLLKSKGQILPVAFIGEDFYTVVVDQLSKYDNIDLSGLKQLAQKNTTVTLTYKSQDDREEIISDPMPPLREKELAILEKVDVVLLNRITGLDVGLEDLKQFRTNSKTMVYMDFHSGALGIDKQGKRYYRRPDDWREWIDLADILQINEMEARTLAGYSKAKSKQSLVEFGKQLLGYNPRVCHITLAEDGSYLFFFRKGNILVRKIDGISIDSPIDAIGCGDAFAAAYLAKYFETKDEIAATIFANKVAAMNCTFVGSSSINKIRDLIF